MDEAWDCSTGQGNRGGWSPNTHREGSESSRGLAKRDLHVLGPAQELVPRVLVAMAEGSEEAPNFLGLPLRLHIRLGVVSRRKPHGQRQTHRKADTLEHRK